jgi:hypothetical protein
LRSEGIRTRPGVMAKFTTTWMSVMAVRMLVMVTVTSS